MKLLNFVIQNRIWKRKRAG